MSNNGEKTERDMTNNRCCIMGRKQKEICHISLSEIKQKDICRITGLKKSDMSHFWKKT
jgi:hypothetical protein